MNWPRNLAIFNVITMVIVGTGCGVKGDPLPPEKPPELGRGRPTYKRATEDIRIDRSYVHETPSPIKKDNRENSEDPDDDDNE